MKKKIYFVIGRHKSIVGIKSYLNIFKKLLSNYDIIISKRLKQKSINIIVENFNYEDVKEIIHYKKNKESKIILVVTEFYNNKLNTFNCFDVNNIKKHRIKKYILLIFYILLEIRFNLKEKLKKFLRKKFNFNIVKYRKSKKILSKKFKKSHSIISNFKYSIYLSFERYFRYFYFKKRYDNFFKIIDYADILMTSHPLIFDNYRKNYSNVYYAMPKLNNFKPTSDFKFSYTFRFSGELNHYRKMFFKSLEKKLVKNQKNNNLIESLIYLLKNIQKYSKNSFIDLKNKKYIYSLNPKRNLYWNFSSPIRYIESINNGEIPIIFDKFTDFFAKNLTIFIDINKPNPFKELSKNFYKFRVDKINFGVNKYNTLLKENNKNFKKELKKLFKN